MDLPIESFEEFTKECTKQISSLQDEFRKLYDLNSYERWHFDEDFGVFHFESDDGRQLYFKYSLVGSFSEKTSTWKWSWDNEYIKTSDRSFFRGVVLFLCQFARKYNIERKMIFCESIDSYRA